jgi:hypothetical protein
MKKNEKIMFCNLKKMYFFYCFFWLLLWLCISKMLCKVSEGVPITF